MHTYIRLSPVWIVNQILLDSLSLLLSALVFMKMRASVSCWFRAQAEDRGTKGRERSAFVLVNNRKCWRGRKEGTVIRGKESYYCFLCDNRYSMYLCNSHSSAWMLVTLTFFISKNVSEKSQLTTTTFVILCHSYSHQLVLLHPFPLPQKVMGKADVVKRCPFCSHYRRWRKRRRESSASQHSM